MSMSDFFSDLATYPFLRYAVIGGLLASISCGVVGSYVSVRRIASIAGAIAHSTLGGLGAALYLRREHGMTAVTPLAGATAAAIIAALIIGALTVYGKQREDTVLSAVWALGMALGVFFISQTRGYTQDLMSYLFGNILMIRQADLWLIAILDIITVGLGAAFYGKLQAICFDEEFARVRGINTVLYYFLLLVITALTIVILVQIVGIVMVIALLTLPAATASRFSRSLWQMMIGAAVLSMAFTAGGIALSYGPDLPAGPTIILLAGGCYLGSLLLGALRKNHAGAHNARRERLTSRTDAPADAVRP
jgi:zinc transport system permease protein